jgi:hypothetical protein
MKNWMIRSKNKNSVKRRNKQKKRQRRTPRRLTPRRTDGANLPCPCLKLTLDLSCKLFSSIQIFLAIQPSISQSFPIMLESGFYRTEIAQTVMLGKALTLTGKATAESTGVIGVRVAAGAGVEVAAGVAAAEAAQADPVVDPVMDLGMDLEMAGVVEAGAGVAEAVVVEVAQAALETELEMALGMALASEDRHLGEILVKELQYHQVPQFCPDKWFFPDLLKPEKDQQ